MSANDIQQIIDKYGRPVYEAVLRQVYVNSALEVAWAIVLIVVAAITWRLAKASWSRRSKGSYADNMGWEFGTFSGYGVSLISVVVILGLLTDAAGALLNPTWKAVEIILKAAS